MNTPDLSNKHDRKLLEGWVTANATSSFKDAGDFEPHLRRYMGRKKMLMFGEIFAAIIIGIGSFWLIQKFALLQASRETKMIVAATVATLSLIVIRNRFNINTGLTNELCGEFLEDWKTLNYSLHKTQQGSDYLLEIREHITEAQNGADTGRIKDLMNHFKETHWILSRFGQC